MGRNSHVCRLPWDSCASMQPSVGAISLWPWSFSTQKLCDWECVMHGKNNACNTNVLSKFDWK